MGSGFQARTYTEGPGWCSVAKFFPAGVVAFSFSGICEVRWVLKILHDPKYLITWESWYYSIVRSCRIFSINSRFQF